MATTRAQQMPMPWAQAQYPEQGHVVLPVRPTSPVPETLLAPAPQVDRFPIVIGNGLTLAYITSTYRLATQGWRWQSVDVWNELLEHDPHARGVVRQRLLPVVAARTEIVPAELPADAKAADKKLAKDICDEVTRQWKRIPARTQALGRLAWGIGYGMSCAEAMWDRDLDSEAPKGWQVDGLQFVHSRRLNVTDPNSWDVYIYDQGPTAPWAQRNYSLGMGLRIRSFPGKFILHCPALNGDYATRDGEFRYIGIYLALKRMIVRCSAQDFERVIRPWVLGYFSREGDKGRQAVATNADINQLLATVKSLGLGSLNAAVLPDAVKVEILKQAAAAGDPREFAEWLDKQVTESLLGQTYTTGPQQSGTHEAAGVAADGTRKIAEYDAQCLADTIERDLFYWIVALNWTPEIARRFCPTIKFAVSDAPNPRVVAEVAKMLTAIDVPLHARKVGVMAGMPVIDEGDTDGMETARTRVITGGKDTPIEPDASNDPNSPNYQAPAVAPAPGQQTQGGQPPKPAAPKPKPAAKKSPKPAKKGAKGAQVDKDKVDDEGNGKAMTLTDRILEAEDEAIAAVHRRLLSERAEPGPAQAVYDELLKDYYARDLPWILSGQWQGPVEIPIDQIDFSGAAEWKASHEDVSPYVERIKGGRRKPIILVQTPGNPLRQTVDGHHRLLASKALGIPALAYIVTVQVENGPWSSLHAHQRSGSSKTGSYVDREPGSYTQPDEINRNA